MLTSGARAEAPSGRRTGRVLLTVCTIPLLIARPQLIYGASLLLELGSEATAKLARTRTLSDTVLTARSGALVAKSRRLQEVQRFKFIMRCLGNALLI